MPAAKTSRFGHVQRVAAQPEAAPEPEPAEEGKIVQLNLKVTPELRKALRARALRDDVTLVEALRDVLQRWSNDEI